jgi:hypothetical protein
MRRNPSCPTILLALVIVATIPAVAQLSFADPSKYPQFAQHKLPEHIKPEFIFLDQLVTEVKAGTKPVIVDVRSAEEFHETHILGSISAPLGDFASYMDRIPKDRLIVLY